MFNELIFVYGTLRQGLPQHHLLEPYCDYVYDGYMQGKLFEMTGYPGAIESHDLNEKVYGEIYKINDRRLLIILDEYEECTAQYPQPHEYKRKKIPIYAKQIRLAWVYLFNHEITSLVQIKTGDYLNYVHSQNGMRMG